MDTSTIVQLVLIVVAALVLFGLFAYYDQFKKRADSEKFNTTTTASGGSGGSRSKRRANSVSSLPPSAYNDDMPEEEEDVRSAAKLGSKYGSRGAATLNEEFEDRMDDYSAAGGGSSTKSNKNKPSFSYSDSEMRARVFDDDEEDAASGKKQQQKSGGGGIPSPMPLGAESLDTELLKPVDFDDTPYADGGGDGGAMNSGSIVDAQELMPADANSKFAKLNPAGQGSVSGQNFLNAGHHIGVNTVGQSLRNASHDIRQTPPNPRDVVSPWMQSTIAPDLMRRPLE